MLGSHKRIADRVHERASVLSIGESARNSSETTTTKAILWTTEMEHFEYIGAF